ncbi:putative metal-binding protein, possibly nucleic-acid binding protein [Rivularia sp. PCC 7116]|uniref:YceD family protein n=1 Tax=Rivularia sp. PCC 7116 TaxID=373994 RepID=UPI00029EF350|nr:YceD family protein [Rivularia sp. PCC 7116]AFY52785.1 putative metal-binding protein, possibly nucleic-acid binding protein [Rivularia sp. PCC 7116]
MDAIYIPQLAQASKPIEDIEVKEFLPELQTLTPVRGNLRVEHRGNFLEVTAKAETIMTLTCNRCLQQYNHRVLVNTSEIIWLDEVAEVEEEFLAEREVALDELVETLSPYGYFHPSMWLYEQMCLEIPQRQLCDKDCPGIEQNRDAKPEDKPIDSRWASLQSLKKQL